MDGAFRYQISSGILSQFLNPDWQKIAIGYSGMAGIWKNNVAMVRVHGKGPIMPGWFYIGNHFTSPQTGPMAMALTPFDGTVTFGRLALEMHGDSIEHPGAASHGCIVIDRTPRIRVASAVMGLPMYASGRVLEVVR